MTKNQKVVVCAGVVAGLLYLAWRYYQSQQSAPQGTQAADRTMSTGTAPDLAVQMTTKAAVLPSRQVLTDAVYAFKSDPQYVEGK